jgi:hypothetical protein
MEASEPEGVASQREDAAGEPQHAASESGSKHPSRGRRIGVAALVSVTTVLLIVGIFSVWANRLLFNPDNWSKTSTQLLNHPAIRSTTANYLVDQLYANVDVTSLISSGLPPRLAPLAAPAAGALRNVAVKGVDAALTRPRIQNLWAAANRAADQSFIAVVNGGKGAVGVQNGVVTLGLKQIVDNVASRLGLPSDLSSKLPPNVANLTVLRSNQLSLVQDVGSAIKGLALWLTILTPLLYALAIALAKGRRRRTLMNVGFAIALAGVIALLGRSLLESQGSAAITNDASLRPTVEAVFSISTGMINEIAGACVAVGLVLVVAAWFAGPARLAVACREALAPHLRDHPGGAYATTLAIMVLIFIWNPIPATGKIAGIIVFLALALFGTYVLREQTVREFPDARSGATMARLRERWSAMRAGRHRATSPPTLGGGAPTLPEQLRELAALRDQGELSADEFAAAKARLLGAR